MDNYFEIDEPKKVKGFTIGKLFKWIGLTVIFSIYAILIVRCTIFQGDVDLVSEILINDTTISAYNSDPLSFKVEEYGMNSPWVAVQEGRLIQFFNLNHIKSAKQLQFAIKYNTDIGNDINDDGIPFKFRLIDNYNNTYDTYFFEQKGRFNYNYIRICFEGIDLIDYLSEPDESGNLKRKRYSLYIDKLMPDGTYYEYAKYDLYTGSKISDVISTYIK